MNAIAKIVLSVVILGISLGILLVLHRVEKGSIAEIGYRLRKKTNKIPSVRKTIWNRLFFWELCKNARFDRHITWIYFSCNVLVVLIMVLAVLLGIWCACFSDSVQEVIVYQLGYLLFVVMLWACVHFFVDIFFLPSERKRYGITNKKAKRRKK